MSNGLQMRDILARLKVDKKVKEGAIFGPSYTDTKTEYQWVGEVEKELTIRLEAYQKGIDAFEPHKGRISLSKDGRHAIIEINDAEQALDDLLALYQAIDATFKLERTKKALAELESVKAYLQNEGLKAGIAAISDQIHDNPALLAFVMSGTGEEAAEE
jgi:hypothetical protein